MTSLRSGGVELDPGLLARPAADPRASSADQLARSLLAHTNEPASVTDVDGNFKYVVRGVEAPLGFSTSDLVGTCAFDLVHPDDLPLVRDAYARVVADPELHPTVLCRSRAKGGQWHWHELRLSNELADPILAGIVCNVTDVTELQLLLQELRSADARQRAIVERSRDITLFFDESYIVQWASPVVRDLLGLEPDALVGLNGFDFIHPDDQERVFGEFMHMTELGQHVRTEFRITDANGAVRWVEEDATNLVADPDVGFIVVNVRDITERKEAQNELEQLALHDRLTGLPNRSLFVNRLEQLLDRGTPAAILDIDIDHFGEVNDSLGHAAGDELLGRIADRFSAVVRSPWTLARIGGDQFVLLCDDIREVTTAVSYAELLRDCLTLPFELGPHEVFISASVGIAMSPGEATDLIRDAGMAKHQAKRQGRDRVVVFDARLDVTQQRRLALQGELRHALARDELVVWYQPIVDLATDSVSGVEALVRWNHPRRGLLGPEHFIDVAETSGLISALGSQVLRKACADAHAWNEMGCPLRVSVNAAAAQLSNPEFVTEIEDALREFDLEADQITIELTETAAMQVADSLDNLDRIRALGIHLSLDDFGTGYSSLSFLRELPVDAIKIDRSFIIGLATNPRDASIVEGVIAMAAALGYDVVAEGIETAAQASVLRKVGCPHAQGYLWSRPAPAADLQAAAFRIERSLRFHH